MIAYMDRQLQALAVKQHQVVLRPQLLAHGYNDEELARQRREGRLVAIRRGAYVDARTWGTLDPIGRHRALAVAVIMQLKVPAVPSHVSAAVLLGMPLWDVDLSVVHVTRTDLHASRLEAGVMHHTGSLQENDLCTIDGLTVTGPARTAVDLARELPFEQGVVVADGALRQMDDNRDLLLGALNRMRTWRGARAASRVVEFADGRAESVGESRARVQFERLGLPRPVLQPVIQAPNGEVYRPDFYFEEEETLGEFDGRSKYARYLQPGEEPADAVWREKRREDALRAMGYGMARLVWADLGRDAEVRARFLDVFAHTRRRRRALTA